MRFSSLLGVVPPVGRVFGLAGLTNVTSAMHVVLQLLQLSLSRLTSLRVQFVICRFPLQIDKLILFVLANLMIKKLNPVRVLTLYLKTVAISMPRHCI